jgi:hypothetical protein
VAAVGELRSEYAGRVEFVVVPAAETKQRQAEIEDYHLAPRGHGLVAFDRAGEAVCTIAGHSYGREEIVMAIGQVLAP